MPVPDNSQIIDLSFAEPAQASDTLDSESVTTQQVLAACAVFDPAHRSLTTSTRLMKVITGAADEFPSNRKAVLIALAAAFHFKSTKAILGQPKSTSMLDIIGYLACHAGEAEGDTLKIKALALLSAANASSPITLDDSPEDSKLCAKLVFWCLYTIAWVNHTPDDVLTFSINGIIFDRLLNLVTPSHDEILSDRVSKLEKASSSQQTQLDDVTSLLHKTHDGLHRPTASAPPYHLDTPVNRDAPVAPSVKTDSRTHTRVTSGTTASHTGNLTFDSTPNYNHDSDEEEYEGGEDFEVKSNLTNQSDANITPNDLNLDSRLDFSRGQSDSPPKATEVLRSFSTADNNFRQSNLTNWTQEHLFQPHSVEALTSMLANEGLLLSTAAGIQFQATTQTSTRSGTKFPINAKVIGNSTPSLQPLLTFPCSFTQLKVHMDQNKLVAVEVGKSKYNNVRHRDWSFSFATKFSEFSTRLIQRWDDIMASSSNQKRHLTIYAVLFQCYTHFMNVVINDRNPDLLDNFDEVWSRVYQYKLTATHPPSFLVTVLTLLGFRCATCRNVGAHLQCCPSTGCVAFHKQTRGKSLLDSGYQSWKASPAGIQAATTAKTSHLLWAAYYNKSSQDLRTQHDSHKRSSPSQLYANFQSMLTDVFANQDRIPAVDSTSNM